MNTIKTKIALYKTLLALTAGAAIGGGVGLKDYNDKVETIAEVPSVFRYELYNKDIIDHELLGDFNPSKERIDKLITYERLENVYYISLDLELVNDINYINKCPNVDTISVMHAEKLNDAQITIINNSSCNRLILYYDDIEVHKEDKLDLSRFKDKEEVLVHFYPTDELQAITFVNYLVNKDADNVTIDLIGPFGDAHLIELVDERLDQIVASLDIKEKDSDYDKLLKIVNFVNNKIDYDETVSGFLSGKNSESDRFTKLSKYYNDYDLSSVIFGDENNLPGVCVNYANLFDILSYKCGLKCRSVTGTRKYLAHAWDLLYLDDNKYFVDLTFSDMDFLTNKINEYLYSNSNTDKEKISKTINDLLLLPLDSHDGYRITKKIEYLDSDPQIIEVNYNVGLDGEKTMNNDFSIKYYIIVGVASAVMIFGGVSLALYLDKKKRERKIIESKEREIQRKKELEQYEAELNAYVEEYNKSRKELEEKYNIEHKEEHVDNKKIINLVDYKRKKGRY